MLFALWLLALDPSVAERATELEARADWAGASALYAEALAHETGRPARFELLLALARLAAERREYGEARRRLSVAGPLMTTPEDEARTLLLQGTLVLVQNGPAAARPMLERASTLAQRPATRASILLNLASVDLGVGHRPLARRRLEEALAGDALPPHEQARGWITLSSVEGLEGDWAAAERAVRRSLAIEPSAEATWNLAAILEQRGRGREAKRLRKGLSPIGVSPVVDVQALQRQQAGTHVR